MEPYLPPILAVASSFVGGCVIFMLREDQKVARTTINLVLAVFKIVLLAFMVWGASKGIAYEVNYTLIDGVEFSLHSDPFSLLFASLSALLWLLTTIYAIGYLEDSPNRSRFFGFFSWCVCSTIGLALAGNLITFLIFYEMLTLATYPLVVHRGTRQSIKAGRVYLMYTLSAGAVLLVAILWLQSLAGHGDFTEGGIVAAVGSGNETELRIIFFMLIAGFGVKAALVPLHGWLPKAMIAPAPVSALLHAVAVVKAGAFGIVRTVYDVFGINYAQELGLLTPLAIVASITIVYGSVRALFQDDLKKRLAYSTVSQVSYIVLGASIFGPTASVGGIVHIVHQAVMKITLFFAAGNLAETLKIHKVQELDGTGKRMPWTMAAFTVAAFGIIGFPPMAGFISKWYLAQGALEGGQVWIVPVLICSAVLNAMYFLPLVYAAWFKPGKAEWFEDRKKTRLECPLSLIGPPVATALFTLALGLFAGVPFSPLVWARFIMHLEYAYE